MIYIFYRKNIPDFGDLLALSSPKYWVTVLGERTRLMGPGPTTCQSDLS